MSQRRTRTSEAGGPAAGRRVDSLRRPAVMTRARTATAGRVANYGHWIDRREGSSSLCHFASPTHDMDARDTPRPTSHLIEMVGAGA